MKSQHITFCGLGPVISMIFIILGAFTESALKEGIDQHLIASFGTILSHIMSLSFAILYVIAMLPALISSFLFSKAIGSPTNLASWTWFATAIIAMSVGPALLGLLIFNGLLGQFFMTILSATIAVVGCGFISRYFCLRTTQPVQDAF